MTRGETAFTTEAWVLSYFHLQTLHQFNLSTSVNKKLQNSMCNYKKGSNFVDKQTIQYGHSGSLLGKIRRSVTDEPVEFEKWLTSWNLRLQGELSIILEESVEYTSIEWKQNRKMSTCKPIGFSQFHVQLRERIQFRGQTNDPVWTLWITAREDPTVSYRWTGWVWEMINQLKFETSGRIIDHFRGICGIYLNWMKAKPEDVNM